MDALVKKAINLGYSSLGIVTPAQKAYTRRAKRAKASTNDLPGGTADASPREITPTTSAPPASSNDGILILSTKVAGTSHVKDLAEIIADVTPGTLLVLLREPDNKHDSRAVVVTDVIGRKIGYLPAKANQAVSALMDAGKQLYAAVTSLEERGRYAEILIDVYLKDE